MNHAASLPFPGHALFVTRIGVCGLAWTAAAICAVQLPEASWGETRERMLLGLSKRHALQPQRGPAAYGAVTSISAVPGFAVQAMAGVQCLLAGVNAQIEPGWAQPSAEAVAAGVWEICGRTGGKARLVFCLTCRRLHSTSSPCLHFTAGSMPSRAHWRQGGPALMVKLQQRWVRPVLRAPWARPWVRIRLHRLFPAIACWRQGGHREASRAVRAL